VHFLSKDFTAPATVILGTLPAGATPISVIFANDVAISGGTPVASVGTVAAPTSYLAAGTLTAGVNAPQAVIAGIGRPTADTTLQVVFTGGVTTGSGRVHLQYIPVV
jgi:selenophosphate synthetase-related protein